ncbi:MAG: MGMT family protein [Aeromonas sobria]|uniref:Cysteine methyltransferase n=1 Tax=Aeromonas sobria TaxID=646 RepID=A0A2N3ITI7_AERSO|nr:MGMT family protein [Aeromonas sobria]ELM3615495.1 MGMT family protein [Aeromonas sobria]PKQ75229.1 cysteine methyltransferase [Aeromonas sobria]HEH9419571.1 MGMT family protein [Aeromonas sobria]
MRMESSPAPLNKVTRIEAILALIPTGKVASYGQVADLAGLPGRARLVGKVLRETDKVLPWHRVLGAAGTISLPKGSQGFAEQTGRLQQEGVPVIGGRVRMKEWQWQPDLAELLFLLPF